MCQYYIHTSMYMYVYSPLLISISQSTYHQVIQLAHSGWIVVHQLDYGLIKSVITVLLLSRMNVCKHCRLIVYLVSICILIALKLNFSINNRLPVHTYVYQSGSIFVLKYHVCGKCSTDHSKHLCLTEYGSKAGFELAIF